MIEINHFASVSFVDLIRKLKLMKTCNRITSKLFTFQILKIQFIYNQIIKKLKCLKIISLAHICTSSIPNLTMKLIAFKN